MTRPWKPHVAVRRLEAALRAMGIPHDGWRGGGRKPKAGLVFVGWSDSHVFLCRLKPANCLTPRLPRSARELRDLVKRLRRG